MLTPALPPSGSAAAPGDAAGILPLLTELTAVRDHMLALEVELHETLERVHPEYQASARNLVHYLAFRQHDLRPLQEALAALGLSSLGRCEAHVLASVEAVLAVLHRMADGALGARDNAERSRAAFAQGKELLARHTDALLGAAPAARGVRIMVTIPGEAAHDPDLARNLIARGMNVARINCARDDAATWDAMISNIRAAAAERGASCLVAMDLAGPKLRTGSIAVAPAAVAWRAERSRNGGRQPVEVLLAAEDSPPPAETGRARLSVPAAWLAQLGKGDAVQFVDNRGKKRRLTVTDAGGAVVTTVCERGAVVSPGTALTITGRKARKLGAAATAAVGEMRGEPYRIVVQRGDTLALTREQQPGRPALVDENGVMLEPARIACTLPEVFRDVRVGERIFFDDGKIGGVITAASDDAVLVRITQARAGGAALKAERGINLPDSLLHLPALTEKDRADLAFVAGAADIVSLSFAENPEDVAALQGYLAAASGDPPGIILKIETQRGFAQLPLLLLVAMQSYPVGVMIARGDLAIECGYERLAEVQEEMLWLCEAAHLPVVWATQVLEQLAKKGLPSRAEITDAAMSERAECVMLNKGPYILEAVTALDDILRRMQDHQQKKIAMLRRLRVSALAPAAESGSHRHA